MPSRTVDVIVLGAGMVGVSAALALQGRGATVTLVDRHGEAADETSFGNAGLVQSEAVIPYTFPRDPAEIANAALNRDPRAHIRYAALPASAQALWQYFQFSNSSRVAETAAAMKPLVFGAADEHRRLAEAAGRSDLLRPTGWIKVWRTAQGEDNARRDVEALKQYDVRVNFLDRDGLMALEPHVGEAGRGGAHFPDPLSTPDPQGLARAYAALFVQRGGRFEKGDAMTLEPAAAGWMVATDAGRVAARDAVIALGPWSNDLARTLGLKLPFFVKRGYHRHYEPRGNAGLGRPVLDLEKGYLVAPMTLGLRLTTGAEFARADDPPSSAHIDRLEPFAREMFPIGEPKEAEPWLGRRPCLPDMRPIVGPFPGKPGLWLDFGHQHLGLTLGPITGRLLAAMMTGETPFLDPAPFRADRFG
ncbi:NAD(P)/FAD-dependent oxidoreductase [Roseiarcus sp.]|uniref:NAD(P)/FAD-dependent oxidoreductase n=1 Tax=Roseiarcus sp. TaxID=1969460 RepID=UPI003F9B28AD